MKIAFVDIDGCLVQDGKLNPRLVERLKGYDQVILFTQRGKHIQQRSLNNKICGDLIEADEGLIRSLILTTDDAVAALKAAGLGDVKVSTSMDPYYKEGNLLDYYPQELATFERELKEHYITGGREGKAIPDELRQSIVKEHVMVTGREDYDEATIDSFYPKGKVEQFRQLSDSLKGRNGTIKIVYYDDNEDNIKEIFSAEQISVKPLCLLVTKTNITGIKEHIALQVQNYIDTRKAEKTETGKAYNRTRGRFFGVNADVKISAAEKVLDKYLNDRDVSFTRKEYTALKEGRLGQIIKDYEINLKREPKTSSIGKIPGP